VTAPHTDYEKAAPGAVERLGGLRVRPSPIHPLASQAALDEMRGIDPAPAMSQAKALCSLGGITSEENIASALREW
jgi:hypothetical protein